MPRPDEPCTECGAVPEEGERCDARVGELIAFDFSDPAYGRVHHLVAVTYQAQHAAAFTDEAVAEYDHALRRHARNAEADPDGIGLRQWLYGRMGSLFAGEARVRSDRSAKRTRPRWSRTVFDVDFADAERYRATVSAWAASAGRDLERWLSGDGAGSPPP